MLIDPDEPRFAETGGMVGRITAALEAQGVDAGALTEGDIVRVVLESLAARYARGVADLVALTGSAPTQLNMVGGGSRNALLCQLTADALGVPVVAGPVEASALGSILAQLEVMGRLDPAARNDVIAATARTGSITSEMAGGQKFIELDEAIRVFSLYIETQATS